MNPIVITKEERVKKLKQMAFDIDQGKRDFDEDEWEDIHEALISFAFRIQFGRGDDNE